MNDLSFTDLFLVVTLLFPLAIVVAGLGMLALYAAYMVIRDKASALMGDEHYHGRKAHS